MAFLCPSRVGRGTRSRKKKVKEPRFMGRITGSDSIDSLVRVGLKQKQPLKPESKMFIKQNFDARVEEELDVRKGEEVYFLYQENEWTYVLTGDGREGFVPSVYCSKIPDHTLSEPSSGIPEDNKSSGDTKSNSSISSVKKYSDTRDADSFTTEGWSDFSKLSSSSLKVETIMQEVRWFRKTSHGQFIVLFDFQALDENDVSVERAELVEVLNIEDPDWSWIRKYNGDEGFVPKSYICPVEPLLAQEKFYNYQNNIQHSSSTVPSSDHVKQPSVHIQQPSINTQQPRIPNQQSLVLVQPLTDAAKRQNSQATTPQNQRFQTPLMNYDPHSSDYQAVSKSANQNQPFNGGSVKAFNQTEMRHPDLRFSNRDNCKIDQSNPSYFGVTDATKYERLQSENKKSKSDPLETSRLKFDEYRTAINNEIKKLGVSKTARNNTSEETNLVPSRNNQQQHSQESVNGNRRVQSNLGRSYSSINNEKRISDVQQNKTHNKPQKLEVSTRGPSPVRQGSDTSQRGNSPVRQGKNVFHGGTSPGSQDLGVSQRGNFRSTGRDFCGTGRGTNPAGQDLSMPHSGIGGSGRGTNPAGQDLSMPHNGIGNSRQGSGVPQGETIHAKQDSGISQISINDSLKTSDITEFILMYDYTAQSKNDLTVKYGDIVYVDSSDQNDQYWLWVYCPQLHKYGYVPRSYVKIPIKTTL